MHMLTSGCRALLAFGIRTAPCGMIISYRGMPLSFLSLRLIRWRRDELSWNLRDAHMVETIAAIENHLKVLLYNCFTALPWQT